MAAQKPSIPKGTRDFGPAEVQKRRYILNTIETVFKKYGFMPIETPTMENLSTLTGKYGDEGDKLLFKVLDSGEYIDNLKDGIAKDSTLISFEKDYIDSILREIVKEIIEKFSFEEVRDFYLIKEYIDSRLEASTGNIFNIKLGLSGINLLQNLKGMTSFITAEVIYLISRTAIPTGEESNESQFEFVFNTFKYNVINQKIIPDILMEINSNQATRFLSEKGLRYDLTVPFARYVVMNRNEITFPFKRYQMQPVWRADRPQKGRYREFWQCDADVVGSDSLLNEVDLILIYLEVFKKLNLKVQVQYNNRKFLEGLSEKLGVKDKLIPMTVILDKTDKIGVDEVKKELLEIGCDSNELETFFDLLHSRDENRTAKMREYWLTNERSSLALDETVYIYNALGSLGIDVQSQVIHNLILARGLSYYTGCILEVVSTEGSLKSSIGGGGRYDNLTGIFGLPNVSGVGISFGLDRIYDVMEELKLFPLDIEQAFTQILFLATDDQSLSNTLNLLKQVRDNDIASEIYSESLNPKKPLEKPSKYASGKKIPFLCLVSTEKLVLKNLNEGTQQELTIEEIIHILT